MLLLDEISEGLWEVDFFENSSERKSSNTGGSWPTWEDRHGIVRYIFWEGRIWILGMWAVPYPIINISLALKIDILFNYWIIPENPRNINPPIYIPVWGAPIYPS